VDIARDQMMRLLKLPSHELDGARQHVMQLGRLPSDAAAASATSSTSSLKDAHNFDGKYYMHYITLDIFKVASVIT